jgi:molybdate transport system substrate-binding protein
MPVSEIVVAPGVDFGGAIPAEIQMVQTFSAAVIAGSKEVEASRRLIQFLAAPGAAEAIKKSGMEPVVASR